MNNTHHRQGVGTCAKLLYIQVLLYVLQVRWRCSFPWMICLRIVPAESSVCYSALGKHVTGYSYGKSIRNRYPIQLDRSVAKPRFVRYDESRRNFIRLAFSIRFISLLVQLSRDQSVTKRAVTIRLDVPRVTKVVSQLSALLITDVYY